MVANANQREIRTIGVLLRMYNLGELNPLEGVDGEGPVAEYSADPTTWDANNLLGRYHLWRITSKFPIPGTAVMNDLKRRNRLTTAAEKEAEAAVIRQNFEKREEALEEVRHRMAVNPVTHTNFSILLDKADAVIAAAEEEVASLTRETHPPPAKGPAIHVLFKLIEEKDVVMLEDMFARQEVDVISGHPVTLMTGLMKAASMGLPQVVKLFLENGADPNSVSKNIQTPLHFGYDVWLSTPPTDALKKAVALDIAKSVIKLLLNFDANPTVSSLAGTTPLHMAARYGHADIVHAMLRRNGFTDVKDAQGRTPADVAEAAGKMEVVKLINAWPVLTKANQSHHFNSAWRFAMNKAVEADAEVASGAMRVSADVSQSLPGEKLLFGNSPSAQDFVKKLHAEEQIRRFQMRKGIRLDVSEGALERQAGPMMIGHEFDTPVAPKPATPKKKGAARDRTATAQAANALASLSDPKPSDPDDPRKAVRFSSPTKLTKEEREAKLACVNEAVAMSAEMSRPSSRNVLRVKDGYGQAGGDTIPSDDNGARPSTEGRPHTHATFASVGGDSVLPAGRSIADSDSDYGDDREMDQLGEDIMSPGRPMSAFSTTFSFFEKASKQVDLRQTVPKASDGMTPEEKAELEAKRELARQKRYYRHKKDLHALLKDRDDIRNYAVKQREKAEAKRLIDTDAARALVVKGGDDAAHDEAVAMPVVHSPVPKSPPQKKFEDFFDATPQPVDVKSTALWNRRKHAAAVFASDCRAMTTESTARMQSGEKYVLRPAGGSVLMRQSYMRVDHRPTLAPGVAALADPDVVSVKAGRISSPAKSSLLEKLSHPVVSLPDTVPCTPGETRQRVHTAGSTKSTSSLPATASALVDMHVEAEQLTKAVGVSTSHRPISQAHFSAAPEPGTPLDAPTRAGRPAHRPVGSASSGSKAPLVRNGIKVVVEDSYQIGNSLLPAMVVTGGADAVAAKTRAIGKTAESLFDMPAKLAVDSSGAKAAMSAYDVITRKPVRTQFSVFGPLEDPWKSIGAVTATKSYQA